MEYGLLSFLGVMAIYFILQFGLVGVVLVILVAGFIFFFKKSLLVLSILIGLLILHIGGFALKEFISEKMAKRNKDKQE